MVLVVHYSGAFEDVRLARYKDRAAAEAARFPGRFAFVVEREDDLLGFATCAPDGAPVTTLTGAGCARIYNAFADEKVDGRFTNRTSGAKRTWRLLTNIGNSLPLEQEQIMEVQQETTEKRRRRAGFAPLGQPKQVREGTAAASVLRAALDGGTIEEIAARAGISEDKTAAILRNALRVNHGIRAEAGTDGAIVITLPDGYDAESIFRAQTDADGSRADGAAPRRSKSTDIDEAAARGEVPEKPIVHSETNAHRQKHFDRLHDLAAAGDWDAVAAYHMKGIDTYSKSINRYRDRLLTAHRVREGSQNRADTVQMPEVVA